MIVVLGGVGICLPNPRTAILLTSYLIGPGGFAHTVVASVAAFLLRLEGLSTPFEAGWGFRLPLLLGHVIGGKILFSLLAYGQVHHEI